ncbi:hypothetical protein SAMN02800694_1166 [Luteibacter sp. UNCMF331Sha3.1]|uniref:hypothetical protein n=1 Tax=Luteibacter sp. UNCMF331Sha3.1 TaxID=1502760 RepID=UPI0008ACC7A9|nr:hypothetical protein [Luteibacter sp. UNCMF331Sha3.1]SEM46273.1 hypothetical protein SAMN02800694_1166 [Luteibacter sp. UNCMF331Sha3.1]
MSEPFELQPDIRFPPPVWIALDEAYYGKDGTIDTESVPDDGLPIRIPDYPGRAPGDTVRVCTQPVDGHQQAVYGASRTVEGETPVEPRVRYLTLYTFAVQSRAVRIHYEVERQGVRTLSQPLLMNLLPVRRTAMLRAPELRTELVDDALKEDARAINIDMALPADRDVVDEYVVVHMLCTGLAFNDPIKIEGGAIFTVEPDVGPPYKVVNRRVGARAKFRAGNYPGDTLRIWYELTIESDTWVSDILTIKMPGTMPEPVQSPLMVGDDMQIHAEPCVVSIGKKPANVPSHAFAMQTPRGGWPPYTFTSSNTLAAVVEATGRIVPTGNGMSVITVTDAAGSSASFNVTVTGATVLMPVRSPLHVAADYRQTLLEAAPGLSTIWYTPGVMAQLAHLRGLWKQYVDGEPSLARRIGFDEDSPQESLYWAFDSDDSSYFRVNLNATTESEVVERVDFSKGGTSRYFIAMVETNLWCGFNGWYRDGERARTFGQPWYTADYTSLPFE